MCWREFAKREIAKDPTFAIRRMVNPIHHRHFREIERRDVFKTGDIYTVFIGIRTPLMEGINPADRAEEMPGCTGVKAVLRKFILAFGDGYTG